MVLTILRRNKDRRLKFELKTNTIQIFIGAVFREVISTALMNEMNSSFDILDSDWKQTPFISFIEVVLENQVWQPEWLSGIMSRQCSFCQKWTISIALIKPVFFIIVLTAPIEIKNSESNVQKSSFSKFNYFYFSPLSNFFKIIRRKRIRPFYCHSR